MFQIFDPTGRTGGELREDRLIVLKDQTMIQAFQQLSAFFQNRQVGAEIRVEHLVEADLAQSGVQFKCQSSAWFDAETLCDSGARSRRGLYDNVLARIGNAATHLADVVCSAAVLGSGRRIVAVDADGFFPAVYP